MNNVLRTAILVVAVLIFAGIAQAQTPLQSSQQVPAHLTVEEAHRIALQNHPRIVAAQASASAMSEEVTQARAAYFPNLYGSITGAESESGTRISAGLLNNPTVFDRFATGLTVEQLVTDFGRTQNLVASARLQSQAAQMYCSMWIARSTARFERKRCCASRRRL